MASFSSNSYDGRVVTLSVSQSGEYFNWTLRSSGGNSNYYTIYSCAGSINGTSIFNYGTVGWTAKSFPAAKGSTSGSVYIGGDSRNIYVSYTCSVYYSGSSQRGGNVWYEAPKTYYTVSFNANGGSGAPSSQTVEAGQSISLPGGPSGNKTSSGTGTTTVSYNANGGSGAPSSSSDTYSYTEYYSFNGWSTSSSASSGSTGSYTPTGNTTLYATWSYSYTDYGNPSITISSTTPSRSSSSSSGGFTITGNANGGDSNTSCRASYYRTTYYSFSGWNTSSSGGGTSYSAGSTYTSRSSVTLYAQWSSSSSTSYSNNTIGDLPTPSRSNGSSTRYVYFDGNGGTPEVGSKSARRTIYYSFSSWNSRADGSGTTYSSSKQFYSSTTVYAQWSSSGSTRSVTLPGAEREYWEFLGWSSSSSATTPSYLEGDSFTPYNNTLYAVWGALPPAAMNISFLNNSTSTIAISFSEGGATVTNRVLYYKHPNNTEYTRVDLGSATSTTVSGLASDINYQMYYEATNAGGTSTSEVFEYSTLLNEPTYATLTPVLLQPFDVILKGVITIDPERNYRCRFKMDGDANWSEWQDDHNYHFLNLWEETTYRFWVECQALHEGKNSADTFIVGYADITTPPDQAKIRIKDEGVWKKGKTFYKKDGRWVKAKKLYMKVDGQWLINENFDPDERI